MNPKNVHKNAKNAQQLRYCAFLIKFFVFGVTFTFYVGPILSRF